MKVHSLLPLAGIPSQQIDRFAEMNYEHHTDYNDFQSIPSGIYCPSETARYGICNEYYDMNPTPETWQDLFVPTIGIVRPYRTKIMTSPHY